MLNKAALGIDVGKARIGVARSLPNSSLAIPVETVYLNPAHTEVEDVADIAREFEVGYVFIGMPLLLSGQKGEAAQMATEFARELQESLPDVQVDFVDERLTSSMAHRQLREAGRNTRSHKSVVDQQSAVMILQTALERHSKQQVAADKEQPGLEQS